MDGAWLEHGAAQQEAPEEPEVVATQQESPDSSEVIATQQEAPEGPEVENEADDQQQVTQF
jgi:hypothetical protein